MSRLKLILGSSASPSATVRENALSQLNEISKIEHIQPTQQHEQSKLIGDDTVIGGYGVMIGGGTLKAALSVTFDLLILKIMFLFFKNTVKILKFR